MRWPHLLRVDGGAEPYRPLVAAVAAAGLRWGWLELAPPATVAAGLEWAAAAGALRAVATGGSRSVAVKPLRGAPVLRDLVREHFRGCALVLVRGEVSAPRLLPAATGYRLEPAGEELDVEALIGRLRGPAAVPDGL